MSDEAYRTKTGKILTEAELDEYVAEAERGYDLEPLLQRHRAVADAIILERAVRVLERRQPEYSFSLGDWISFLWRAAEKLRQEAESGAC